MKYEDFLNEFLFYFQLALVPALYVQGPHYSNNQALNISAIRVL